MDHDQTDAVDRCRDGQDHRVGISRLPSQHDVDGTGQDGEQPAVRDHVAGELPVGG
jgi:hypothetical protein